MNKRLVATARYRTPIDEQRTENFEADCINDAIYTMCVRLELLNENGGYHEAFLRVYDQDHPAQGLAYAKAVMYKGKALPRPTGSKDVIS